MRVYETSNKTVIFSKCTVLGDVGRSVDIYSTDWGNDIPRRTTHKGEYQYVRPYIKSNSGIWTTERIVFVILTDRSYYSDHILG